MYPNPNSRLRSRFDFPESRKHLAQADIVLAADPDQETRTLLYGRERLEQINRSRDARKAVVVTYSLDTPTEELDVLEQLVFDVKGSSSFRPTDLFPEIEIDTPTFDSDPELLKHVRLAVAEIVDQHRTLLPRAPLRFHYSIAAAGFATAREELRLAADEVEMPLAYLARIIHQAA